MSGFAYSTSFSFLARHNPQLAELGTRGELYCRDDPATALIKLRQFGEKLAEEVCLRSGLLTDTHESQYSRLRRLRSLGVFCLNRWKQFEYLRRQGNAAAHTNSGSPEDALDALKRAQSLAEWFHIHFDDSQAETATDLEPEEPESSLEPVPVVQSGRLLSDAREFLRRNSPVLVLAQTREAADDIVRLCCSDSGDALVGAYRHTLRDLVLTISDGPMVERGLTPVRRLAREAIAANIAAQNRRALRYLGPVASFPRFSRALARTLEDLRLNRIGAAQLQSAGRTGADLALLLQAYEQALRDGRFADHAERCALALGAIEPRSLLLLDLDTRGRIEREFIAALKQAAPTFLQLSCARGGAPETSRLGSLQRFVLSGRTAPALPDDGSVGIFSASGEALECVEIARRILRLAEAGTKFDRISILLRSPGRHLPLVDEALHRAGIPAWYSGGVSRPDIAGRAFLALLRCAAEELNADRFAEYLSLGEMPAKDRELPASSRWERLLSRAAVISGLDRWERRLQALANTLTDEMEAADSDHQREQLTRDLNALEALRDFALPVIRDLAALPAAADWRAWLDTLGDLAGKTIRKPAGILGVLAELEPMASISPVLLTEVLSVLEPELATHPQENERQRYGHVFVGAIEDVAGMTFDVVFVPGFNEGIFPKPLHEDPLLLDVQRETLGIESSPDDARLLRIAAGAAAKQFVCSWSRLDLTTGRERVPSFYAFEVADAAGFGELDVQSFIRQARDRSSARLGWPAPADPADAIDSAEYDLAALHPYWDPPQPGAAAWLKSANPHVYRSAHARRLRWSKQWTHVDGLTGADVHVGLELERRYSLKVRAYAPTRLEQYARCPYRFYLQSVLGLRAIERAAAIERIDARTRGELYHEVQTRFYRHLSESSALPVTSDSLDTALETLEAVLRTVAAEFAERCKPAIPAVWNADVERIRGDLRGWVRHVALNETRWKPIFFEREFKNVPVAGGRLLQGRIDLIEECENGDLRVTDHKTGKLPENNKVVEEIGAGEFLQPVLYAMAVEAQLGRTVREARLFYATLRGNYAELRIDEASKTREAAESVLAAVESALCNGELPAAPRSDACTYCDYLPICGPYEERRTSLKPPLPGLVNIRRRV